MTRIELCCYTSYAALYQSIPTVEERIKQRHNDHKERKQAEYVLIIYRRNFIVSIMMEELNVFLSIYLF